MEVSSISKKKKKIPVKETSQSEGVEHFLLFTAG
jgi:hypothetical protein